jgi:hypothetical protein
LAKELILSVTGTGTQQMIVKGDSESDVLTIPLDLAVCMVHFEHRLHSAEEMLVLSSIV